MKPGSLFWFGAGMPTGYEVPFDEPACILIFKGGSDDTDDKEFLVYLRGLEERLQKQRSEGVPFTIDALPDDHPSKVFARHYG